MVSGCLERRKFFYRQGNFFILYGSYQKKGITISLGPHWFIFLPMWLACVYYTILSLRAPQAYETHFIVTMLYVLVHFVFLIAFLITGICDAGVIRKTEDNSIENGRNLESLNFTYCSICGIYRPQGAGHCEDCGVCFYNYDHHCAIMGQCVARNNLWTFYLLIIMAVLTQLFHLFLHTDLYLYNHSFLRNYYTTLGKLLHII